MTPDRARAYILAHVQCIHLLARTRASMLVLAHVRTPARTLARTRASARTHANILSLAGWLYLLHIISLAACISHTWHAHARAHHRPECTQTRQDRGRLIGHAAKFEPVLGPEAPASRKHGVFGAVAPPSCHSARARMHACACALSAQCACALIQAMPRACERTGATGRPGAREAGSCTCCEACTRKGGPAMLAMLLRSALCLSALCMLLPLLVRVHVCARGRGSQGVISVSHTCVFVCVFVGKRGGRRQGESDRAAGPCV